MKKLPSNPKKSQTVSTPAVVEKVETPAKDDELRSVDSEDEDARQKEFLHRVEINHRRQRA